MSNIGPKSESHLLPATQGHLNKIISIRGFSDKTVYLNELIKNYKERNEELPENCFYTIIDYITQSHFANLKKLVQSNTMTGQYQEDSFSCLLDIVCLIDLHESYFYRKRYNVVLKYYVSYDTI